jgi:hypothetical protein
MANETFDLVHEYATLENLRKLGYTQEFSNLSVFKAECFAIIGNEFARLAREEAKRGKINR